VLDRLAALLIENETIESEEFESLFEGILPPRGTAKPAAAESDAAGDADATKPQKSGEGGGAPRRRRGPAPQPA